MGIPAIGVLLVHLYFCFKLIDRNKRPERSNIRRIPSIKEFPISTEFRAKSNVNQLLFLIIRVLLEISGPAAVPRSNELACEKPEKACSNTSETLSFYCWATILFACFFVWLICG